MKIGELARASGIGVETIRYYQRRDLLAVPPRFPGSKRHYPDSMVQDIQRILQLKALGLSLDEIQPLVRAPVEDCSDVRRVVGRRIQETRRELQALRRRLGRLEQALPGCPEGPEARARCGLICLLGTGTPVVSCQSDRDQGA